MAKKVFVGSLPDGIAEEVIRGEFSRYGDVEDVYVKANCEPGRQWAFVTFASHEQAVYAKDSCDRQLYFPGSEKACDVTLARNQGKFGQEPLNGSRPQGGGYGGYSGGGYGEVEGPKKIFVGSLPDGITEEMLQAEFCKYGRVVEVFIKLGEHSGRHWAFVTFDSAEQASAAKVSTDRILSFPGSTQACEVKLAKNQGKFGQNPMAGGQPQSTDGYSKSYHHHHSAAHAGGPPPPPTAPPPAHLTPWRMYKTVAGIPYYHNSQTNATQWECPPDLAPQGHSGRGRYSPY